MMQIANELISTLMPPEGDYCEQLQPVLESLKDKINSLELRISDFEKGNLIKIKKAKLIVI